MNKLMYASTGAVAMLFVAMLVSTSGCTVDKADPTTHASDAAMHDPMNYHENVPPPESISGGDIGNLDRKAFKRDMDSVFNP